MGNSFNITGHGPTGGDQCSEYFIDVSPSATVVNVIDDILSNKNEWGDIRIERGSLRKNDHKFEYKYGKLLKDNMSEEEKYFWNNLLDWKVVAMRGYGGWSCSDYWLTIQSN